MILNGENTNALEKDFDKIHDDPIKYSILRNLDRYRILDRLTDKIINFINLKGFSLFIEMNVKRDTSIYEPLER